MLGLSLRVSISNFRKIISEAGAVLPPGFRLFVPLGSDSLITSNGLTFIVKEETP